MLFYIQVWTLPNTHCNEKKNSFKNLCLVIYTKRKLKKKILLENISNLNYYRLMLCFMMWLPKIF